MNRQQVKSGALAEVGYDAETHTLEILFPSKALWRYYDVPPETFAQFMRSDSLGRFFAADIRACFRSERVHIDGCSTHGGCSGQNPCPCWCHLVRKDVSNAEAKVWTASADEPKKADSGRSRGGIAKTEKTQVARKRT